MGGGGETGDYFAKFVLLFLRIQLILFQTTKKFADDNFVFDENGKKFPSQVENTVGKGEIARHDQFLLFPQCFQKTYSTDT